MAAWQFDAAFVPRPAQPQGTTALRDLDELACWAGVSAAEVTRLRGLGVPMATWAADELRWGAEDSTCVVLAVVDGAIASLRMRLDLRDPAPALLLPALAIARALGLVIVTEAGETFEPETSWLLAAARRSAAARFASDPRAFVDGEDPDRG